ncbi:MAG: recombinase family protein [Oscillospiraceae bacterium]
MDLYLMRNELQNGKSIYDLKLKVTYYARVSTDKDEQLNSIKNQIDYYEEYIRANLNWAFIQGYIDEGISGTSVSKRESFLQMIKDAKASKFDFIITKEISRFSRNTIDSINYTQKLLACGVGVFFQSDNINTLMPDAELRLTIMSSIAQDEVRKISERVKFGFRRAVENGVVLGSNRIWGYEKDAGKLIIVEKEAQMVREIFDMYANKALGMRSICARLADKGYKNSNGNNFSFSTIKGIITNPKYKGYYCGNKTHKTDYKLPDIKRLSSEQWVMYKDETGHTVPAIVSEELWEKANLLLAKRSKKQRNEDASVYSGRYVYSGKIICMVHSAPYYRACFKYKTGDKEVWQCKIYAEKGRAGCTSPILYTAELNEIMRQTAHLIITNKDKIMNDLVAIYSQLSSECEINKDIAKCKLLIKSRLKYKDKLLDLNVNGKITDNEFEERNNGFNDEIKDIENKISEMIKENVKNKSMEMSKETLQGLISQELLFKNGLGKQLTDAILERIEVYCKDDKNKIDLKLYLKTTSNEMCFEIERKRACATSVRYIPYICSGQI